jgi:DNA-binding transcriptional LysR family regulator
MQPAELVWHGEYALTRSVNPMPRTTQDWEGRIGRRVTLRDLHILSAVVRRGSMSKAASHLAMSQSAVSEAIANLEHALDVRLLDRRSHGIEPTIYANALLKRGDAVFDELKQGIKEIEFLSDPTAGEVRIASPEFLSAGLVPAVVDRLLRRYPKFVVHIIELNTATVDFRELQERKVDLLLTRIPANFVGDEVDTEVLLDDPHVVIAGTRSRWAGRRNLSLAELVHEPWIFPAAPAVNVLLEQAFEAHGLQAPSGRVTTNSIHIRCQLVASGRFLSVLTSSLLRKDAKKWPLKALPIDLPVKPSPVTIVTLRNRTVGPAVQIFIEELRVVAKSIAETR